MGSVVGNRIKFVPISLFEVAGTAGTFWKLSQFHSVVGILVKKKLGRTI